MMIATYSHRLFCSGGLGPPATADVACGAGLRPATSPLMERRYRKMKLTVFCNSQSDLRRREVSEPARGGAPRRVLRNRRGSDL